MSVRVELQACWDDCGDDDVAMGSNPVCVAIGGASSFVAHCHAGRLGDGYAFHFTGQAAFPVLRLLVTFCRRASCSTIAALDGKPTYASCAPVQQKLIMPGSSTLVTTVSSVLASAVNAPVPSTCRLTLRSTGRAGSCFDLRSTSARRAGYLNR